MSRMLAVFVLLLPLAAWPQQPSSLLLTVTDENANAVPAALVEFLGPATLRCVTDHAGRCLLRAPAGSYRMTVNKDGFYTLKRNDVRLPEVTHLDLTLAHVQEVRESVSVVASTPQIDPAQVAGAQSVHSQEIIDIPYPTTRDIREILPFIPGVVRDTAGQAHVAGGAPYETLDSLDGFNIAHPVTGTLDLRFSSDAVRSIDVQESRYSAQFGRASAGVLDFATGMGDDRLRFSATNFIPSVQNKKGLGLDKWTPRVTLSGPINKQKAWFLLAPEGEYDTNVFKDLPAGADRSPLWRMSNLAKAQVNLTPSNILTGSFLYNHLHSDFTGLSLFQPKETATNQVHGAYLATIKDQQYFSNGMLFEIGAAVNRYRDTVSPLGTLPYVVTPDLPRGNFFESTRGDARRLEFVSNLYLPPRDFAGRHELRIGFDLDRLGDTQRLDRRPVSIFRANGTLYSTISFACGVTAGPACSVSQNNTEFGFYAQDRWTPVDRLLLQPGIRVDHDTFTGRSAFSPRLGATYMLTNAGETKLSAGVGFYHDPIIFDIIGQPSQGERLQTIFDPSGATPVGPPLFTIFSLNPNALQVPRFLNWSVGLERRMPAAIFVKFEYMQRRGARGFSYDNLSVNPLAGQYVLTNTRRDRYRAFQISARRHFHGDHEIMAAYTRSRARSNQVVDYTLDNFVFSPQAAGVLPWDAPNKLTTWGFLPLPFTRHWSIAYSGEWHTGFPFSVVNQQQQVVGAPDSRRFPDYFSLNFFLEWRFALRGLNLALRGGFEDITGRQNPFAVNNNVDSPNFLQFEAASGRAFTARIRFLGRKK